MDDDGSRGVSRRGSGSSTNAAPAGAEFSSRLESSSADAVVSDAGLDDSSLAAVGPDSAFPSSRSSYYGQTRADGAARASSRSLSAMDVKSWSRVQNATAAVITARRGSELDDRDQTSTQESYGGSMDADFATTGITSMTSAKPFIARPPPPPPLTPPKLSTAVFKFEDRRPYYSVSVLPSLDALSPASPSSVEIAASSSSFSAHGPNPDYMASTSSADMSTSSTSWRRSYTKNVPVGMPSQPSPASTDPYVFTPASETFSPSSFPPSTSPLLPPASPGVHEGPMSRNGAAGFADQQRAQQPREIDVQGEIISVVDDATGAGWTRHTRVYGGGVCLACVAAASAGVPGGFYGDRVRPEDRR